MVEQTKKLKIEGVNRYLIHEAKMANSLLRREEDAEDVYDDTYKATLDAIVKDHEANIVKMLRWLMADLTLPTPDAFTDGEVDAINPDIRTQAD
jgi:hypothetical protein